MTKTSFYLVAAFSCGLLSVLAQSDSTVFEGAPYVDPLPAKRGMDVSYEFNTANGYGFSSGTSQPNENGQKIGVMNNSVDFTIAPKVGENFILRFGGMWDRYSISKEGNSPVPNTLQAVNLKIGFDTIIDNEWILRIEAHPGFYSDFADISYEDFQVQGIIGASYLMNENFQWFFGAGLGMFREIPVFPAIGFRWKFADSWVLNAMLPKPRLTYELDRHWEFFLGGNLLGGTFRTGEKFGEQNGNGRLNSAVLDYIEGRAGLGVKYKITPSISVEADGGYTVYRDFDYVRGDLKVKGDPAPYVNLSISAQF